MPSTVMYCSRRPEAATFGATYKRTPPTPPLSSPHTTPPPTAPPALDPLGPRAKFPAGTSPAADRCLPPLPALGRALPPAPLPPSASSRRHLVSQQPSAPVDPRPG